MSSTRAELIEQVLNAGRLLSTETVMFHAAIADTVGLSPVETKTIDYLERLGPQTPKELARSSGLAPASVTALIDRLEGKGIVRRGPHPEDRRKVLVELRREQLAAFGPQWESLLSGMVELCGRYSDDQLQVIVEFITETAEITHRSTAELTEQRH
ncbi:MarR family winged helix-turn-helix transcriptional regulator [Amycolatopsis aidingensis]|uniref:MarR family winged helix-turn-helix transcriptional regulator n=1 Tax=Amycolatopsis aidingensis TaxID=2842453 RepID=UPI001C0DF35E|nr:MarR family transcriptional regulator [Amycolatopsis aidingensis]